MKIPKDSREEEQSQETGIGKKGKILLIVAYLFMLAAVGYLIYDIIIY